MHNCRKCGVELDKHTHNKSDRIAGNYICKVCKMDGRKNLREQLRQEDPVRYKCRQMRSSAMKRSSDKEIPFDISEEYLIKIAPKKCPVFGFHINYASSKQSDNSASLDRIKPELGYVEGNVQIISKLANTMKSSASKSQMFKFAKWVIANY